MRKRNSNHVKNIKENNYQTLSMKSEFTISENAFILYIFNNKAKEF